MLEIKIKIRDTLTDYSVEISENLNDTEANYILEMVDFVNLRKQLFVMIEKLTTRQ